MADGTLIDTIALHSMQAFQRDVGRGKSLPVPDLADIIGCGDSTIKQCRSGELVPSLRVTLLTAKALPEQRGAAFLSHIVGAVGFGGVAPLTGWGKGIDQGVAQMMHHITDLLEKRSDGTITPSEESELRKSWPEFVAIVLGLDADIQKGKLLGVVS